MKIIICIAITAILTSQFGPFMRSVHAAHQHHGETREPLSKLPGLWKQKGYSNLLEITQEHLRIYQLSSQHCLLTDQFELTEIAAIVPNVLVSHNRRSFRTDPDNRATEIHSYGYRRVNDFPDSCKHGITEPTLDPVSNFNVFWHTFNENYAYFEERKVDWQKQYDDNLWQVEQLSNSPADQRALFEIMGSMIHSLDRDGHSGIAFINPDIPDDLEIISAKSLRELETRLQTEFEVTYGQALLKKLFAEQDEFDELDEFTDYVFEDVFLAQLDAEHQNIILSYMEGNSLTSAANNNVRWGKISGNIGYLQIRSMDGFLEGDDTDAQFVVLDTALDQAMTDLRDTNSMVVDIRQNGGGADYASLAIASRFYDRKRLVFHKKARNGQGFSNRVRISITPAEHPYVKPVYVLTSSLTASAAEVFTLAMKELPYVNIIGENTNGIFSDVLDKTLPNGWNVGLSNEVYADSDRISYEYIGVTPDKLALMYDKTFRGQQQDPAFEAVLGVAGNNRAVCAYTIRRSWRNGFLAEVTITNISSHTINRWSVNWRYDDNSIITNFWGAELDAEGGYYYAKNLSWNEEIQSGESVRFGVLGKHNGTSNPVSVMGDICN